VFFVATFIGALEGTVNKKKYKKYTFFIPAIFSSSTRNPQRLIYHSGHKRIYRPNLHHSNAQAP